jgi:hypothetical protein
VVKLQIIKPSIHLGRATVYHSLSRSSSKYH